MDRIKWQLNFGSCNFGHILVISNGTRAVRSFDFEITCMICTSEFFKKLKLHEPLRRVQFRFLKNSQVQINSKLNEKNRMITY